MGENKLAILERIYHLVSGARLGGVSVEKKRHEDKNEDTMFKKKSTLKEKYDL